MPLERGQALHFLHGFLHVVLAEHRLPGGNRRSDALERLAFGDCQQNHFRRAR
jgi:hypothetical protein